MINHSEQISNLAAALLKAQKAIGRALKSAENPYYKSNYADLTAVIDSVKEPLNDNGITFMQAVDENNEGKPVIDTILLHESGQFLSTRTPVFCNKPNDPQAFGSGVTYSKRYSLQAILGLPTEDDDAEKATDRNGKTNKSNNITPPNTSKPPDDVTAIIEQVFFNYKTEHAGDCCEGFAFNLDKFKEAMRETFSAFTPAKKKTFKWTSVNVTKMANDIQVADCLVEVPA